MWVRGLKQTGELAGRGDEKSHPMWVRGLKHINNSILHIDHLSHPMWVRGLKPKGFRSMAP